MKPQLHFFYIITISFRRFSRPYLKENKEENRPNYYCFESENDEIYWMIPVSSKIEKYKKIVEHYESHGRKCIKVFIIEIAGREIALLIQDMFPVTEEYIVREFTIKNIPLKLLDTSQIKKLKKELKKHCTTETREKAFENSAKCFRD
ncbi:hypothetical protein B0S84_2897 [Caldicellulosiruptor bescii]|nr:hypothetical protein B0S84_2897 [Caldicellulosiruptor bescii]